MLLSEQHARSLSLSFPPEDHNAVKLWLVTDVRPNGRGRVLCEQESDAVNVQAGLGPGAVLEEVDSVPADWGNQP